MLNRDPAREAPRPPRRNRLRSIAEPSLRGEGLASFRRAYRWLNLTLIQQGVWPLLIVVLGAPAVPIGLTPHPWYWARAGAPLLAALLALGYLAQRPAATSGRVAAGGDAESIPAQRLREQATILIVGATVAVAILRLVQGPIVPVLKLEGFGLADVAAYQAINFGVAGRAAGSGRGSGWPAALFGLSWALHDLALAAASPAAEDLLLTFASGAVIGLAFGALSWGLRRWPGGDLPAGAAQFLVVYLILGYLP